MTDNSFWFRHDSNSHMNGRMLKLQSKYGWEGYGMFWFIIENLYNNDGKLDTEAMQWLCSRNAVADDFLEYCVNIGLLQHKDNHYFSNRLDKEISNRKRNSEIAREKAEKRWHNKSKGMSSAAAMRGEERREENIINVTVENEILKFFGKTMDKPEYFLAKLKRQYSDEIIEKAWKKCKNSNISLEESCKYESSPRSKK